MSNQIIHYPKRTAEAETTRRKHHKEIGIIAGEDKDFEPLVGTHTKEFSKTYFELSGVYPYIFDTLAYVCTCRKDLVELKDDAHSLFFRVQLSIDQLLDFTLDRYNEQKYLFLKSLVELSIKPVGKIIPISSMQSVTTTPILVSIFRNGKEKLTTSQIKRLENIGSPLPIAGVQILFFKPLFHDLLIEAYGENWFPLPKAFQAKLLRTLHENVDNPALKKLGVKGMPATYRRYFLYLNAKDNSKGEKLILDSIDLWERINPGEVQEKDGHKYLLRWKKARTFLHKANEIFNIMAREGRLTGAKIAPQGVWYEPPLKTYTVYVKRKDFKKLQPLEDCSSYKEIEHFQEKSNNDQNVF